MSLNRTQRVTARLAVEPPPSGPLSTALVGVRIGEELEHLDREEVEQLLEALAEARA